MGIRLIATGDIMLGRRVGQIIQDNGFTFPFELVKQEFEDSDIIFGNLESPLTLVEDSPKKLTVQTFKTKGAKEAIVNQPVVLKTDPSAIKSLKDTDFNMLSFANNHTMDFGKDGYNSTLQILRENKIPFLQDMGLAKRDDFKCQIFEKNDIKIGFIGYQISLSNYLRVLKIMSKDFKNLIPKVDLLIISVHWGIEDIEYPTPTEVEIAHNIIDMGAALILGHHPHVPRGIEKYKDKYIVCSLGNFIFDQDKTKNRESFIFKCNISKEGIKDTKIVPIYINNFYQPQFMNGIQKDKFLKKMEERSKAFVNLDSPVWKRMKEIEDSYKISSVYFTLNKKSSYKDIIKNIHKARPYHLKLFFQYLGNRLKYNK